jgi:formylglycine-generating enzyme required for sulfatase activity
MEELSQEPEVEIQAEEASSAGGEGLDDLQDKGPVTKQKPVSGPRPWLGFGAMIAGIVICCLSLAVCAGLIIFGSTLRRWITTTTMHLHVFSHITDEHGVEMVLVPAGEFLMGSVDSDEYAASDEKPQHKVYLDSFYMDLTEVTNAMYRECVEVGACSSPYNKGSATRILYFNNPEYDHYPVIYVDWAQARDYCQWRGARLPTEAEWEKAARGADGRIFPPGNIFDGSQMNFCDRNCTLEWADKIIDDGYADTSPVGSYPGGASPYGLLDMAGNVWEWVNDRYLATYYFDAPFENPMGPPSGQARIIRGGSWLSVLVDLRVTTRGQLAPSRRVNDIGFRCARTP